MRQIDYKEGRELELTHVCKECGDGLVTVWRGEMMSGVGESRLLGYHAIKCSENPFHIGEVRKGSIPYHLQPREIQNAIDRKERIRKERNGNSTSTSR